MAAGETIPDSLTQEDMDPMTPSDAEAPEPATFPAFRFDGSSLGTTKDVKITPDPLSPIDNHIRDFYWSN